MYGRNVIVIAVWCFMSTASVCKIISLSHKKVNLINTIETKNCFISYVLINGKRYLIKQKKADNKQISVVRDALAAYIAKSLKIAHEVDIISCEKEVPGKICNFWPATIHTIASGDTIRTQRNSIYSTLRLKQQWALAKTFAEKGLTRNMIAQMTWHRQLPVIVALDILIGNSDRHCGNLCYDPDLDKFCAIDMDDTFNKDLCFVAYKKLDSMFNNANIVFTHQEINAFIQMRKTIVCLLNRYPADHIVKKLYYFAKKAGFVPGSIMYTPSIQKKLNLYQEMILESWVNAHKLVVILDRIIDKHRRNG